MPNEILNAGIEIVIWFQGLGDWLLTPMSLFTFLGNEEFYLLVMPALYWCIDASLGFRVGIAFLLSAVINGVFKLAIHDPRPFWIDPRVRSFGFNSSFGIPSGHSQNAVVIWGLIAGSLRRSRVWIVTILLIVLIGLSRIYLGVHFPTDVLTGWLIGAILLIGFVYLEGPARSYLKAWTPIQHGILLLICGLIILLAVIGTRLLLIGSGWEVPDSWIEMAANASPRSGEIDPLSISDLFRGVAVLFGFGLGRIWIVQQGGFRSDGPIAKRLTRFLIGIVIVYILSEITPTEEDSVGLLMQFVITLVIGGWIAGIGPYLFLRLGLVEPANGDSNP
jgi:membrane-associated phospholipid phosphatase